MCAELTTIAEACLAQALTIIEAQLVATYGPPPGDAKLAVLGLGKLGGRELGYAADLDVVFVFSAHDDEAVAWFSRCAQRLGDERARLAATTVDGAPVGDPTAVAREIRATRERIERELGAASDLKTGAGGILDIEFAAQYLQLVHGHAHPALRTTSTQAALRAAAACGIAPTREIELLDQAYTLLRTIEHRMRVVHDQPIQRLPETRDELDKLARRSGFLDGSALLTHVARWQREIRAAYHALLGA